MQTLQDLVHAFRLYAVCESCQRVAAVDLPGLIAAEGGDYPLDRVRMRLYCTVCASRSQALRIVYVGPEGRASGFRYARQTSASRSGTSGAESPERLTPEEQVPDIREPGD